MRRIGYYAGPGPTGAFTDRTAQYLAFIATNDASTIAFADLYTITLRTLGTVDIDTGLLSAPLVFRIAGVDYDVAFEGLAYAGGGFLRGWRLTRESIRHEIGAGIPEMALRLELDGADLLPPADGDPGTARLSLGEALYEGLFDNADVLYRRLIMPAHPTFPISGAPGGSLSARNDFGPGDTGCFGAVTLFAGQISEVQPLTRSRALIKVKGYPEKLAQPWPRHVFKASCRWTLYDDNCRVSRTGAFASLSFQRLDTVTAAPDLLTVESSSIIAHPTGYFDRGTLQFTSGALCGLLRPVAVHTNLGGAGFRIELGESLPRLAEVGAGFVLQAGCDKVGLVRDANGLVSAGTCGTKFDNLVRFGGFPHIPPPSTAY